MICERNPPRRANRLQPLALALLSIGSVLAQSSDSRFVIVLIGPPGGGKTTQSAFLQREFGLPTIAADDLIRDNPQAIEKYQTTGIDPGPPQASPALNDLVRDRLTQMDLNRGVVLDGYPATKDQADHLASLVREHRLPTPIVIQLDVPDKEVRKRLRKRKTKEDTPAIIERRLKDYHRELEMIRTYYPEANIWTVDGTRSPAGVSKTIQSILKDEVPQRR
jgi:adenylate kinase